MKKLILAALIATLALTSFAGFAMADTTWANVGTTFTIFGETPIYTDTSLTKEVAKLPNGQKCVVVASLGNMVEVYTVDTHKVGWMTWSNSVSGKVIVPAIVLAQNVSLRETANTASKLVMSIGNGEIVNVLSEANGWYYVEYNDRKTNTVATGYLRVDFLQKNPQFIIVTKLFDVYAMPVSGSKKVAQVAQGNLVVIGEYNGYVCVNVRTAAGFIRKSDVGY
ncbi:MAG: SH3 domain-containing protein [Oscillospiraceae bacterium]|jgi:uncharacterized protein YgiM (DUF1202 family)|nr:SH3 domain-containing protein [Oscillospiraceae bacterium]